MLEKRKNVCRNNHNGFLKNKRLKELVANIAQRYSTDECTKREWSVQMRD